MIWCKSDSIKSLRTSLEAERGNHERITVEPRIVGTERGLHTSEMENALLLWDSLHLVP